jgi:hypothetical protein
MNLPARYVHETIMWHPNVPGRKVPDVTFDCVYNPDDPKGQDVAVLLVGYGEGEASGACGVDALDKRRTWGVATGLPFGALGPDPVDLERIMVEGPLFLAEFFGRGRPVRLVTCSLSALAVHAVKEAPELFTSVRSLAPFPLVTEQLGRVPLLGSHALTRRAAVGLRLGVLTPMQLAHRALGKDGEVRRVGTRALATYRAFGPSRNAIVDHGFHPETGRRTADTTLGLLATHDVALAFGDRDQLVRPGRARQVLAQAARRAAADPRIWDGHILMVRGPHAPLCSPEGFRQLTDLLDYQIPAASTRPS